LTTKLFFLTLQYYLTPQKKVIMKKVLLMLTVVGSLVFTTSCTMKMNGMSESNAQLNLTSDDVVISEVKEATATEKLILMVDWKRIFKKEIGEIRKKGGSFSLPIIGNTSYSRAEGYAIYKLLKENPDYDAVLYPQFSGTAKGILPFFLKTDVTVKAKLVKVN
jgi:hypothetical protein